ncbi:hypothetical protein [Streptomyces platensis]
MGAVEVPASPLYTSKGVCADGELLAGLTPTPDRRSICCLAPAR